MSITVSKPNEICNSQLNHSKSKSLYSFPKSKRFNTNSKPLCDAFYEKSSTLSTRQAGFGYGKKSDFTSGKMKTPAPCQYNIKAEIDQKKEKNGGWSFGESRGKMKGAGIFQTHLKGVPGPGTYNDKSQLSNIKFSMRPKTANPDKLSKINLNLLNQLNIPLQDKHQDLDNMINMKQLDKMSSGATTINPQSSKRFKDDAVPGPGKYSHDMFKMNKTGTYYVSKLGNSMCRSFAHQKRQGITEGLSERMKVPGVGNYRLPSEFGYYENAKKY